MVLHEESSDNHVLLAVEEDEEGKEPPRNWNEEFQSLLDHLFIEHDGMAIAVFEQRCNVMVGDDLSEGRGGRLVRGDEELTCRCSRHHARTRNRAGGAGATVLAPRRHLW